MKKTIHFFELSLLVFFAVACNETCDQVVWDQEAGVYVVVNEETGRKWMRCPVGQEWYPDRCKCIGTPIQKAQTAYEAAKLQCPPGYFWPGLYELKNVLCNYQEVVDYNDKFDPCRKCSVCKSMFGDDRAMYLTADGFLDKYEGRYEMLLIGFGTGSIVSDLSDDTDSLIQIRCVENRWLEDENGGTTDADADTDTEPFSCENSNEFLDVETGLCWKVDTSTELLNYQDAEKFCSEMGGGDWSLPKIDELISLIQGCGTRDCYVAEATPSNNGCTNEYCNDGPICEDCEHMQGPAASGCYWNDELAGGCTRYWSRTDLSTYGGHAWTVGFHRGHIFPYPKIAEMAVRCVKR
jgi:hypothetical protein